MTTQAGYAQIVGNATPTRGVVTTTAGFVPSEGPLTLRAAAPTGWLQGIDIASYQGPPDFAQVAAAGYSFVYIKATQGATYVNPYYARNRAAAKAAGLIVGSYHYATPDSYDPATEVAHFQQIVGSLDVGELVALDMESGTGDLLAWSLTWLRGVEAALGPKPLFYSGAWFMQPHNLTDSAELGQYGLWIAAYQNNAPTVPAGWDFWADWQYSASSTVPGVAGVCDVDYFNGTRDLLLKYGKQQDPPPPADPCAALKQTIADALIPVQQAAKLLGG